MPGPVVQAVARHVEMAVANPELSERLSAMGFEPLGPTPPAQFGRYVASEIGKWSKIIKQAGIELQQ